MDICVFVYVMLKGFQSDEEALKEFMMFDHFARFSEDSRTFQHLKIIFRFSAVKSILYLKLNSRLTFIYWLEE